MKLSKRIAVIKITCANDKCRREVGKKPPCQTCGCCVGYASRCCVCSTCYECGVKYQRFSDVEYCDYCDRFACCCRTPNNHELEEEEDDL